MPPGRSKICRHRSPTSRRSSSRRSTRSTPVGGQGGRSRLGADLAEEDERSGHRPASALAAGGGIVAMAQVPLRADVSDGDLMLAGFWRNRRDAQLPEEFDAAVLTAATTSEPDLPAVDPEIPLVTLDPPVPATWIRRCIWNAMDAATGSGMPLPTCRPSRRQADRWMPSPIAGRDVLLPRPQDSAASAGAQRGSSQPAADVERPGYLWRIDLDSDGEVQEAEVERRWCATAGSTPTTRCRRAAVRHRRRCHAAVGGDRHSAP